MAAQDDSSDAPTRADTSANASEGGGRSKRRPRLSAADVRAPVLNMVAGIVRWVGLIFAVVLVVHVVLVIGEANPNNGITTFFANFADTVSLGFKNLFTPSDAKLRILVNYGIAALVWLVVTALIARILKRLA